MRHRFSSWFITMVSTSILWVFVLVAMPRGSNLYSLRFNYQTVFLAIAIIVNLIILVLVVQSRSEHSATKWYALMSAMLICGLSSGMANALSNQASVGLFWDRLSYTLWITGIVGFLMFCISYSRDEDGVENTPLFISLVTFTALTGYLLGSSPAIGYQIVLEYQYSVVGYEVVRNGSDVSLLPLAFLLLMVITGSIVVFRYSRKQTNVLVKKQLRIFNIAFLQLTLLLPIDLGFSAGLWRTFYGHQIPSLTALYLSNLGIIVGYGILKYGIFKINPSSMSGTILANMSEAVVATDSDFVVEFVNSSVVDVTGYSPDRLRAEHVSILFNSDRFDSIVSGVKHADQKSYVVDETEIKNNQGQPVPVTLSVEQVASDSKRRAGYIFVFANISELKKKTVELAREKASVEQKVRDRTRELSEEHARLTASINSLNIGFIMSGVNDEYLTTNPTASILLAKLAEAQGVGIPEKWTMSNVVSIFAKEEEIVASLKTGHKENKSFEFKEVQIDKWFIHVFIAPVAENNQVIGAVILLEDITEEKVMNRSKDEFFIIASHELRTPLTKIRGSAEIMQDVYKSSITSDEALKMLDEIEHSSGHLIDIVNDFIEMSELEQGKVVLKDEDCNVGELVREVVNAFGEAHKRDGLQYRVQTHGHEQHATLDKSRLTQLIVSLLDNSYKFTESGEIRVELSSEEHALLVRVIDTGKGIKLENQSILFHKFQQAGSSLLSRDGEGTGLGLYIAKLIVDHMGGEIGLESSEEGKGSVFFFTLPKESHSSTVEQTDNQERV